MRTGMIIVITMLSMTYLYFGIKNLRCINLAAWAMNDFELEKGMLPMFIVFSPIIIVGSILFALWILLKTIYKKLLGK